MSCLHYDSPYCLVHQTHQSPIIKIISLHVIHFSRANQLFVMHEYSTYHEKEFWGYYLLSLRSNSNNGLNFILRYGPELQEQ